MTDHRGLYREICNMEDTVMLDYLTRMAVRVGATIGDTQRDARSRLAIAQQVCQERMAERHRLAALLP